MHTHSYREPEQFTGQRVVVVGASASGEDISREIASVARKVDNFPMDVFHSPASPIQFDLLRDSRAHSVRAFVVLFYG